MKTNVSQASIEAYHDKENKKTQATQRLRVIEHIIQQTKAGRPCCIASIADHFQLSDSRGLGQKSTVSARVNEIEKQGAVIFDQMAYEFKTVEKKKYRASDRTEVTHFCLILKKEDAKQMTFFE